jgi:hypothetical protein
MNGLNQLVMNMTFMRKDRRIQDDNLSEHLGLASILTHLLAQLTSFGFTLFARPNFTNG